MIPTASPFFTRPNFIKQNIVKLEKNILILSEEQLNNILKEIYRLAEQEFFEKSLLSKLLRRITKKKEYYYHKQYSSYNWPALLWAMLTLFVLSLILMSHYYWTYTHTLYVSIIISVATCYLIKKTYNFLHQWCNPKYQEYEEYYEKLSFIEKKLQQKINNLRKKYATKKK